MKSARLETPLLSVSTAIRAFIWSETEYPKIHREEALFSSGEAELAFSRLLRVLMMADMMAARRDNRHTVRPPRREAQLTGFVSEEGLTKLGTISVRPKKSAIEFLSQFLCQTNRFMQPPVITEPWQASKPDTTP